MVKKLKTFFKNFVPRALRQRYKRRYLPQWKPKENLWFEVMLTDHCNLNCKSCSHFCPLAKEKFADIKTLERDFKRLSELSGGKIDRLVLLGGEPLLHPQLLDIIRFARKHFPQGSIRILSNGILLPQQPPEFWQTCHENSIEIEVSVYPIKIDIPKIEKIAAQNGVNFYIDNKNGKWWHIKYDTAGKQNKNDTFDICVVCIMLADGKLYCGHAYTTKFFNDYFGQTFELTKKDSIDIYKVKNIQEIHRFFCKPQPFCRYCNKRDGYLTEWALSKREKTEWL